MDSASAISLHQRVRSAAKLDYDCIKVMLDQEIDAYRMQSMEAFSIDYKISAVPGTQPTSFTDSKQLRSLEYEFDFFDNNPKQLRVRLNRRGQVRIWYCQQWASISALLKYVKPARDWNKIQEGLVSEARVLRWAQQKRWWYANGKKFELLRLPAEIRELVCISSFRDDILDSRCYA